MSAAHITAVNPLPSHNLGPLQGVAGASDMSLADAVACDAELAAAELEANVYLAETNVDDGAAADPHSMAPEQARALHLYTQDCDFYKIINRRLRNADRSHLKTLFPVLKLLFGALACLPRHRRTLHRGVKRDLHGDYTAGKKFVEWSMTSCTTSISVLSNPTFLGQSGDRTIFSIDAWDTVSIQAYSAIPSEDECILFPGTPLVVKSVLDAGNGLWIVHLEQRHGAPWLVDIFRHLPRELGDAGPAAAAAAGVPPTSTAPGSAATTVPSSSSTSAPAAANSAATATTGPSSSSSSPAPTSPPQTPPQTSTGIASCVDGSAVVGHTAGIAAMTYSPDGATIATGSWDCTARLWDIATGACKYMLWGHNQGVQHVVFAPNGALIATVGSDNVRMWDVATGVCRHVLRNSCCANVSSGVAWSPDSAMIVAASLKNTVCVWVAQTGVCQKTLVGHSEYITDVAYSPDGATFATGSNDGSARVWDAATGASRHLLKAHTSWVQRLVYSPDGTTIATSPFSLDNGALRVWDVATGACRYTCEGLRGSLLAFSPDNSTLVTACSDYENVQLLDAATGSCRLVISRHLPKFAAFSPDSNTIILTGHGKNVAVHDAATGARRHELTSHDVDRRNEPKSGPNESPDWRVITAVSWSPDGTTIATAGCDGTVRIWDAQSGTCCRMLDGDPSLR